MIKPSLPEQRNLLDRELRELTPHVSENAELVNATLTQVHTSVLRRLFPGELERVVRSHDLAQLQTGFDYRRRALHHEGVNR